MRAIFLRPSGVLALGAMLLSTPVAASCPSCQDEECLFGKCVCIPRIGCTIPLIPNITPLGPGPIVTKIPLPPYLRKHVDEFGHGATPNVIQLGGDTLTTLAKASGDTMRALERAGGDVCITIKKAKEDTVKTTYKAANDAFATYVKAWRDVGEEGKRNFEDATDAVKATGRFIENQARDNADTVKKAVNDAREGKLVEAAWRLHTEPLKTTEENFATATQESDLIANAASSAATYYGGPGGAAIYASWSTYRRTGNVDMALRAAVSSAIVSQGGAMPSGTAGEIIKKAAVAGAVGGIAVAAAGGDKQAIKDGFLKSSGAVLIQGSSGLLDKHEPRVRELYQTSRCISARDVDCLSRTTWARDAKGKIERDLQDKLKVDPKKIIPSDHIGKWSRVDPETAEGKIANHLVGAAKLPNVEAIPILGNEWVLTWTLGKEPDLPYARPTVVLTFIGEDAPFISRTYYGKATTDTPQQMRQQAERPDTGDKLVAYYVKPADRSRVTSALDGGSLPYTTVAYTGPEHSKTLSNALICGPNTKIADLKRVAFALQDAGVDIKYIGTKSTNKPGQISILNLQRRKLTVNTPNITRAQIEGLSRCPKSLSND